MVYCIYMYILYKHKSWRKQQPPKWRFHLQKFTHPSSGNYTAFHQLETSLCLDIFTSKSPFWVRMWEVLPKFTQTQCQKLLDMKSPNSEEKTKTTDLLICHIQIQAVTFSSLLEVTNNLWKGHLTIPKQVAKTNLVYVYKCVNILCCISLYIFKAG